MSASNTTETKKMEMDEDVMGLDADLQERTITVVCGKEEKKSYSVSLKYLQISKLINTALEQDRDAAVFPLLDVTPAVFEQLLPYLVHHNGVNGTIPTLPNRKRWWKTVLMHGMLLTLTSCGWMTRDYFTNS
jgi:hypothetical protein